MKTAVLAIAAFGVFFAAWAPLTHAQPAGADARFCSLTSYVIDHDLMEISALDTDDLTDSRSPAASIRAAKAGAIYGEIQTNLLQLAAHHCAPYPHIISKQVYARDASTCALAMLKAPTALSAECDREKWKPIGP
jgi:hypothetical protein